MAEVKNYWLKIEGKGLKFNIPKDLVFKKDNSYPMAFMVDIIDDRHPTNQDGTEDCIYVGRSTGQLKVYEDGSKKTIMLHVDKRSQSKKLRGQIFNQGRHYDSDMVAIRHLYTEHIIPLIDKLKSGEID